MNVHAIIPVKTLANSKKRLERLLTIDERISLSEAMLRDVLDSISKSTNISRILVVSNDGTVLPLAKDFGATFLQEEEERGVNAAVALADPICKASGADATVVIPHDLPLIMPSDLDMLCDSAREEKCVIVTPSHRYDGTNALLRKPPDIIKTHYDEDSYEIHVQKAREKHDVAVRIVLNKRLMLDLDELGDIEPIVSSKQTGRTSSYLQKIRPKLGI